MVRIRSPVEISKHLPGENCGGCGAETCFEFALLLTEKRVSIDQCTHLSEVGRKALWRILAPPMKEVTFGSGVRSVRMGGEEVMYRHELTFLNQTVIAIDVWDTMCEDELVKRLKEATEFVIKKIEHDAELRINAIAIRCVSGDKTKFAELVSKVIKLTDLPLILCSLDPDILEAGLKVAKDVKPLIYAATKNNWSKLLELAEKYKPAVALSAPGDLNALGSLAKIFSEKGIEDLVLDPSTFYDPSTLTDSKSAILALRKACVENEVKEISYPAMAVPASIHACVKDPEEAAYLESCLCAALITKGISLLITHSISPQIWLSLTYLRLSIFKHPKLAVGIKSGLYEFNEPDQYSPLLISGNCTLTFNIVSGDLGRSKVPSFLLVVDTKGLTVDTAVGSGDFSADVIADFVDKCKVEEKIKHKILIIPGVASDLLNDLKTTLPNWRILIGPKDSKEISKFVKTEYEKQLKEFRADPSSSSPC